MLNPVQNVYHCCLLCVLAKFFRLYVKDHGKLRVIFVRLPCAIKKSTSQQEMVH